MLPQNQSRCWQCSRSSWLLWSSPHSDSGCLWVTLKTYFFSRLPDSAGQPVNIYCMWKSRRVTLCCCWNIVLHWCASYTKCHKHLSTFPFVILSQFNCWKTAKKSLLSSVCVYSHCSSANWVSFWLVILRLCAQLAATIEPGNIQTATLPA